MISDPAMVRALNSAAETQPKDERLEAIYALDRLITIAKRDTGQSRRVANFLLAWWNASRDGGFDFTDLWQVDREISDDMVKVFTLVANSWHYPDHWGYQEEFEGLVKQWRSKRRRRA